MKEPRPFHLYLAIAYAITLWVLVLFCLTYHWKPVWKTLDDALLDYGRDEIHYVN